MKKQNVKISGLKVKSFTTDEAKNIEGGLIIWTIGGVRQTDTNGGAECNGTTHQNNSLCNTTTPERWIEVNDI